MHCRALGKESETASVRESMSRMLESGHILKRDKGLVMYRRNKES